MISICLSCFLSPVAEQFVFSPEHSYNFLFLISLSLLLHPACLLFSIIFPPLIFPLNPLCFLSPSHCSYPPSPPSVHLGSFYFPYLPLISQTVFCPNFVSLFSLPSLLLPFHFSLYCPIFLSLSLFALFVRSSLTFQCMSSPKPALGGQR